MVWCSKFNVQAATISHIYTFAFAVCVKNELMNEAKASNRKPEISDHIMVSALYFLLILFYLLFKHGVL